MQLCVCARAGMLITLLPLPVNLKKWAGSQQVDAVTAWVQICDDFNKETTATQKQASGKMCWTLYILFYLRSNSFMTMKWTIQLKIFDLSSVGQYIFYKTYCDT